MAVPYKFRKFYQNLRGLDLRAADLLRDPGSSTGMKNIKIRPTGALSKREGYQYALDDDAGGYGATTFDNVNSAGVVSEEFITIDENLFKMSEDSFTVTYAPGNGSTGRFSLYWDHTASTFIFDIYDGSNVLVTNTALGNGYSGLNITVSDLRTAIDALTDLSTTAPTFADAESAAFIPIQIDSSLVDGVASTITFKYWTQIDTPSTYSAPFSTFYGQRTDVNFENATFAQLNDLLYIATGHDSLHKYDGLRVYKAGIPKGTIPTDSTGAGSNLTAGEYDWKYTYSYTDAKQNIIESTATAVTEFTSAGTDSRVITVTNLQETSGYNVDQAIVSGTQSTVTTIDVDSGHGIKAGDYIYISDGVTSSVVSRSVGSITATTVVITGDAVTVTDNDIISNIKISLWRTKSDGTLFYLTKELINDYNNDTQTHDDDLADASAGVEYIPPLKNPDTPPNCKYITVWRDKLVMAGDSSNTSTVYYSDINPEFFPAFDNSFIVRRSITGIRAMDNNVFVFRDSGVDAVSGNFSDDTFSVDTLTDEGVGCKAHATIQEVNRELWFLASDGVYSISAENLTPRSDVIESKFRSNNVFSFKQAVAYNWNSENKYMLFLPNIPVDPTYASDDSSEILVFDYFTNNQAWLEWNNFNFMGGISILGSDLYMTQRRKPDASVLLYTQRIMNLGIADDYMDQDQVITASYSTHWEAYGEPGVFKKYLRLKVYSIDVTVNDFESDSFTLTVNIQHNFLNSDIGTTVLDFSGGGEGWGAGSWGNFLWGEVRLPDITTKLTSKKSRSMRLIYSNNTAKENILIAGYELEVATPYRLALKE